MPDGWPVEGFFERRTPPRRSNTCSDTSGNAVKTYVGATISADVLVGIRQKPLGFLRIAARFARPCRLRPQVLFDGSPTLRSLAPSLCYVKSPSTLRYR